jgi:intracellular sulfur oxidation DsrE/DsrF family protein
MKKVAYVLLLAFAFQPIIMKYVLSITFFLFAMAQFSLAQEAQSPMVPGFGAVYEIPGADKLPDPKLEYKIVIDVTAGSAGPSEVNPSLFRIARALNLHALGGVPEENIQVVAVVHSKATPVVLDNEGYRKHFNTDNPNGALIHALADAGVELYICGQSLIARGYADDKLHPRIKMSISAMTILAEYQLKGYVLMAF